MPKGHSLIGAYHAQLVRQGVRPPGVTIQASTNDFLNIGTMYVSGLTLGAITPDMITRFTNEFAKTLNINPLLLKLEFTSGSLIIKISFNNRRNFNSEDNAFLINAPAIIRQIKNKDIDDIIENSGTRLIITGSASIDHNRVEINIDIRLQQKAIAASTRHNINNPMVGDNLNNCMYTLIGSSIVRISNKGVTSKICTFPETSINRIYITNNSQFLIIPTRIFSEENLSALGQNDLKFKAPHANKIYVINIETKQIFINTTQIEFSMVGFGFNPFNNKIYYNSAETDTYFKVYTSIISFSSNSITSQLGSTILSSTPTTSNILFTDENTGFIIDTDRISIFNVTNNTITRIAGQSNYDMSSGAWKNVSYPSQEGWTSGYGGVYAPFKDAPIGNNAWFTYLSMQGCFDDINNKLYVADLYSHRIRSIDLSSTNYPVSTLAGTTPIQYTQARNNNGGTFSDDLLDSLGQVGVWNNGTNSMPVFTKVNSNYLESTFDAPQSILMFDGKIFIKQQDFGTRLLSNGYVSDFTVTGNIQ